MTERVSPFAIVPVEAACDHRLTAMQYRVLIAILSFRNRNSDTCYPSRDKIAQRTGYSITNISRVTATLVELGWLEKVGRGGRSMPTHYRITVPETVTDPATVTNPETVAGPETVAEVETVAGSVTKTVADPVTKTVAGSATGKEQTIEQTKEQKEKARAKLPCPEYLSQSVWDDYLKHRKQLKAPLTETAWKPIEKALFELRDADGLEPDDVLAEAMAAGWRGLKAQWVRNRLGAQRTDGHGERRSRRQLTGE